MKISQAIERLQEILKGTGDLEIIHIEEVDGRFYMEWDRVFDVIGIPDDEDAETMEDGDGGELVVAFMQSIFQDDNFMGPEQKTKKKLKVIK